jgi:hypothetical protein
MKPPSYDLDDLNEAEGGPQPAEGRELVIIDLGHTTMMPPSWLESRPPWPASSATASKSERQTAPPGDGAADSWSRWLKGCETARQVTDPAHAMPWRETTDFSASSLLPGSPGGYGARNWAVSGSAADLP